MWRVSELSIVCGMCFALSGLTSARAYETCVAQEGGCAYACREEGGTTGSIPCGGLPAYQYSGTPGGDLIWQYVVQAVPEDNCCTLHTYQVTHWYPPMSGDWFSWHPANEGQVLHYRVFFLHERNRCDVTLRKDGGVVGEGLVDHTSVWLMNDEQVLPAGQMPMWHDMCTQCTPWY